MRIFLQTSMTHQIQKEAIIAILSKYGLAWQAEKIKEISVNDLFRVVTYRFFDDNEQLLGQFGFMTTPMAEYSIFIRDCLYRSDFLQFYSLAELDFHFTEQPHP